ncbi:MAG: peptidoglycan-binding protein [Clostridia bacterium]|nr:peptidoglycan-binding protein [Clostridia bacterium]
MKKGIAVILAILIALLQVPAFASWICPNCGTAGNTGNFCPNCGARNGYSADEPYDMGIPYIGSAVYTKDQMNMAVLWVQTQLKATGIYYQGYAWDVTGNLGNETQKEIRAFMNDRGYYGHTGNVDQSVIDALADYLGGRIAPVYIGGYYDRMSSIMTGGSAGRMTKIVSNLQDGIAHVTTGARWVQCCLSALGFYTGTIDGKYGEGTEKAVKAFQRAYGFQERDYVTLGVARAMLEACYYSGRIPANLP